MNKTQIQPAKRSTVTPRATLLEDTYDHINAVTSVLSEIGKELNAIGSNHDHTKIQYFDEFQVALESGKIKETKWWQKHLTERHHLNSYCPDNVNLFDVLEMLADGVCAGKARGNSVYQIELSNDILQKALANTQKIIEDMVEVIGDV
jgi:hypothetical protein